MGTRGSFLGLKQPGREADHSPPSSAEVKECVKLYLRSQYAFMAWCSVKEKSQGQLYLYCIWGACKTLRRICHEIWNKQSILNITYNTPSVLNISFGCRQTWFKSQKIKPVTRMTENVCFLPWWLNWRSALAVNKSTVTSQDSYWRNCGVCPSRSHSIFRYTHPSRVESKSDIFGKVRCWWKTAGRYNFMVRVY
jgi:hypothetical protein